MTWFPRFHTAEEVARTLIAGLEDGSLTLDGPTEGNPKPTDVPTPRADALPKPTPAEAVKRPQMDTAPRG